MTPSLLLAATAMLTAAPKDETVSKYEAREVQVDVDGQSQSYGYRLLKPAKIEPGKTYPVVLFLHGAGERGDDNTRQLLYLPELMAASENQEKYPCFLIAPQCPSNQWWTSRRGTSEQIAIAVAALEDTLANFPCDTKRIYLTGLSMGGFGSWSLAARQPERFAALVPICGGGSPESAEQLKAIPIWAFHGDKDSVVPVTTTRTMVEAIRAAGGDPKYTELEGVGHDSWTPAYGDPAGVIPWMFEQVNNRAASK